MKLPASPRRGGRALAFSVDRPQHGFSLVMCGGHVKSGDSLPHLPAIKSFLPYFRCMGDVASRNRYTYHEGTSHHIPGTRGGIQGDPIKMTRF